MVRRALILVFLLVALTAPLALFKIQADAGGDYQRLDSILEERLKASTPALVQAVDVLTIGFDDGSAGSGGFTAQRGLKDVTVSGGILRATVTDPDNLLVGQLALDAAEATGVVVRLRIAKSSTAAKLFWAAPGESPDWPRGAPFLVQPGDKFESYFVPVEDSPAWKGSINSLALSMGVYRGDVPCTLEIDEIKVIRASPLARHKLEGRPGPLDRAEIAGESRRALYSPAPGLREARVRVPHSGVLSFGFGMLPSSWYKPGDGVTFRVSVSDRAHEKPSVLFAQYVNPKEDPSHRRWFDESVSLAGYGGRDVDLRLETLPGPLAASSPAKLDDRFDDAVWSSPILASSKREPGPNVIIVLLDTVRADHLGLYGYRPNTSPKLNAFAAESVVFRSAYSTAPETLESVMSIVTSLYPSTHGVLGFDDRLDPRVPTLAGELSKAGFFTSAITEGGSVAAEFGFDTGFDSYVDVTRTGVTPARPQKFIEHTFERARAFLRGVGDRRFFLLLHTYEPHTPYAAPPRPDRNRDPDYRGSIGASVGWQEIETMLLENRLQRDSADAKHIEALYDQGIQYTDDWLGKVIDELKTRRLLDDTIVVVTSDHGEDLFDHIAIATHGHSLYEELIRVPLVIRLPADPREPVREIRMVEEPVSLVDLLPTLLDSVDLAFPPGIQGRSFLSLLNRHPRGAAGRGSRAIFAEDQTFFVRYATRVGSEKLIESPGIERDPKTAEIRSHIDLSRFNGILREEELYDLVADPHELRNLAADGQEPSAETRRQLDRFLRLLIGSKRMGACTTRMTAETRARLMALGYLK